MSHPLTAAEVLAREFLEIRCKILDLAASLDRLNRAEGSVATDPRLTRIAEGLQILASPGDDRAERIQLLFSRTYAANWPSELGVKGTPR